MAPDDDPDALAALRRRLLDAGAGPDEVAAAAGAQELLDLSGSVALRPDGAPISLAEAAGAAGVPVERAQRMCEAAGLRADDLDSPLWFTSDVDWIRAVDVAVGLFGEGAVLALLRRAGAATLQLAHASAAAFRVNVVSGEGVDAPVADRIERNLGTRLLVDTFLDTMSQLYRHHVRTAVRSDSVAAGDHGELRFLSVAFVDLSSSTAMGASVTATELARLIVDFETAAFGAATRAGARVVKTIGDEVMLCADEPAAVCCAALDLVAFCAAHETLPVARGGVAAGDLLEQDGDCYGPVVNRAARFAQAAPDGTVMVDGSVVEHLRADDGLVVASTAPVEHRGLGVVPWWRVAGRSPDDDTARRSTW